MEFSSHPFSFDPVSQNLNDVPLSSFLTNDDSPPQGAPIYLMKELPPAASLTGSTNLLAEFGLEATYNKFCGKKLKESLSSFLPDLSGGIDPAEASDGSTLRSLIEKRPAGSKEIQPLSSGILMSAFRLHPGPLPEQYRPMHQQMENKRRHKHHKSKNRPDVLPVDFRTPELDETKKHKKRKHDDGSEKKKKKKDKKRKNKEKKMVSGGDRSYNSGASF